MKWKQKKNSNYSEYRSVGNKGWTIIDDNATDKRRWTLFYQGLGCFDFRLLKTAKEVAEFVQKKIEE